MGKILALDIGHKRVGIAVSDQLYFLAHPYKTIPWQGIQNLVEVLKEIVREQNISELVVGVPYTLAGGVSQKTREILKVIAKLKKSLDIPIVEVDESLTTSMAEEALRRMGKKPSRRRDKIDQIAAVFILQNYLDSKPKSGGD